MAWKLIGGLSHQDGFDTQKMEVLTGTSNGSGVITLTFTKTYSAAPMVFPFATLTDLQHIKVSAVSTTGATVHVFSVASDTATDIASKAVSFLVIGS